MTDVHLGGIFHPPTHHGTIFVIGKYRLPAGTQATVYLIMLFQEEVQVCICLQSDAALHPYVCLLGYYLYPVHACAAGVKQCRRVCVCVCVSKKIFENASSRVARAFKDLKLNEKLPMESYCFYLNSHAVLDGPFCALVKYFCIAASHYFA